MSDYPVLEIIPQLKQALATHRIVILQAPPGAGKSTILPLQLLDEAWMQQKKIIMLEPRRLAAKSVAERMSFLQQQPVGEQIGYRVRFDTKVSSTTRIEVVTEGILTRMIQTNNDLGDVGLLIFDEFHERSLHADLALALGLQIQQVLRDDLRILIMSATLDGQQLSSVLNNAPIITSQGRQFPVQTHYAAQETDSPLTERVSKAVRKALREAEGDMLVFLPGAGEIKRTQEFLESEPLGAKVYPLYGDLSFAQQQEAILPRKNERKIVLATSIAETSLTIEGIKIVIDGGYARVPRFDPRSGLTRLETVRVTKDSADQRAGRAGRLGPGICYRLWTEATQRNLLPQRKPEIVEADLASLMLELALWGVKDIHELTWVTPPPAGAVSQARELLIQLDAINEEGITARGKEMARLPTHPRIAHLLLTAKSKQDKALVADIAAVLEERDPLTKEAGADFSLRIETLRKWRAGEKVFASKNVLERIERLAANWRRLLEAGIDNTMPNHYAVGKFLMEAYPERIARQQQKQSEYYTLSNGRVARLPDSDPLFHETWLCIAQVDAGSLSGNGKIFLAAPLHADDLSAKATEEEVVRWDTERRMVTGSVEKRAGGLLLGSRPVQKLNEEQKNKVLIEAIRELGLRAVGWNNACDEWQARVMSLRTWRPQEAWPDMSDEYLLETLHDWLSPYLGAIYKQSELEKLDWLSIVTAILPWELQSKVDKLAPARVAVPSGSDIRLQYFADGRPPVMEVRLQEVFGLAETPTVNEGCTKILLHLLSPGYKPVQVTQDLKSFWHAAYHEVRKELRIRYPKHSWPEDPWTAQAVRGVKRKA
ncbi:MAG: ATP-dependent helicase HrpB [Cyclobacteriaceae bacterium]|nr:ATP-dependent helicase HrpB [Cyclobacteriaceae bacterium]